MATAKNSKAKNTLKASPAKVAKRPTTASAKKSPTKKSASKKVASNKVDYYPNRMTFWVSAAAGSLIVLIAIICAYNR